MATLDVCIYFGTAAPEPELVRAVGSGDIVLEPYHPLVRDGGFAEVFPDAQRYVYVNPTSVDPWHLERMADKPPIEGTDDRWRLPRLDHRHPAALDWAVATAQDAWHTDGGRHAGLFVDDLDRLLPDRPGLALEYLERVGAGAARAPRWFVNRAFALWNRIPGLDAVLLEDLSPPVVAQLDDDGARWLREQVLPAVRSARGRGVRVHALSYDDQAVSDDDAADDRALEAEFRALVDSVTTGADRALHLWRTNR